MNDIAEDRRAYAEAGPWDRLGNVLRIGVAVLFLVITVVFFATAQNGLISASDIIVPVGTPTADATIAGS
tara:strand:- start:52 stop:261 length:210 start_codon:yes stop_codon:yes gene_type:complete